jgi:tetratricopeptide (TPR) repeat protein
MEDIFALHDAIATAVVEQMKISLLPEDRAAISLGGTDVSEAYDLLLQFWGHFYSSFTPLVADTVDPDDGFMPMTILDRALALDPDYVDVLIAKAAVYNLFAFQTTSQPRMRQFIDRAKPIVARLMELAPEYSATWSIKGMIAHRSGNTNEAIDSFARAIELNPNDANAHQGIAIAYGVADPLKTIEHFRIARELDPENPFDRPLVLALARLGRIDEAISTLESGLKGMSGLDQMRLDDLADITYSALGRPDTSARWSGELLKLQPGSIRGAVSLARTWLAVGDLERAERWIARIERIGGDSAFVKMIKIRLNNVKGDMAAAMNVLDSMGRPQGPMATVVLQAKTVLCIIQNDLDCARTAVESFGKAVDMAAAKGFSLPEWHRLQHLLSATVAARSGGSADDLAQQVVIATRGQPRSGWVGKGIYYEDAEAFVLLGKTELALQALEEALLADGGFLPLDSFMTPADRGLVLSDLDGVPGFEDWKTRFRARRDAMRERMIAMEAAGEIPTPPAEPR